MAACHSSDASRRIRMLRAVSRGIRGMRVTAGMIVGLCQQGAIEQLLTDFPYSADPDLPEARAFGANCHASYSRVEPQRPAQFRSSRRCALNTKAFATE